MPQRRRQGAEAYLLHCTARLAATAGSPAVLADADRLLEQADIPADSAWLLGEDAYLALAKAWLDRGEPERGRAVLAPLLALAERVPWTPALAAALAADARALIRLGERERARARAAAGRAAGHRAWPGARPGGCEAGHALPRRSQSSSASS